MTGNHAKRTWTMSGFYPFLNLWIMVLHTHEVGALNRNIPIGRSYLSSLSKHYKIPAQSYPISRTSSSINASSYG